MTNAEGPPRRLGSFANVDSEASQNPLFTYLEMMDRDPVVVAYRRQALVVSPRESILDIGSGVGGFLRQAQEEYPNTHRLVGVDRSERMLERAYALTPQGGITYVLGDAHSLPLGQAFDLVYSERTFQHLSDPVKALAEAASVTRSGGHVVFVEPNWKEFHMEGVDSETISILMRAHQSNIPHFDIGSKLGSLFAQVGLTNVEVTQIVTLPASGFEKASQIFRFDGSLTTAVEGKSVTEKEKAFALDNLQKAGPAIEVSLPLYMVKGMKE